MIGSSTWTTFPTKYTRAFCSSVKFSGLPAALVHHQSNTFNRSQPQSKLRLGAPLPFQPKMPAPSADVADLVQLQSEAAYPRGKSESRAGVNVHEARDRDERSTSISSSDFYILNLARCSRCQRTLSTGSSSAPAQGVVRFGTNLYYCARCANMVGWKG